MTRQAMTTRLQRLCGTTMASSYAGDPFAEDEALTDAANEIAQVTKECFVRSRRDLVAGQEEYCAPGLFRITNAFAMWNDGSVKLLIPMRPEEVDARERSYTDKWRTAPQAGNPALYIPEGRNKIKLYPVPDTSTPGGLFVEGYGVPGDTWPNPADECPLPEDNHLCVCYLAALNFLKQNPNKETMARVGMLEPKYRELRAEAWRAAATQSNANYSAAKLPSRNAYSE